MSCISSPGPEVACSQTNCSDSGRSDMSSGTPTARRLSKRAKLTAALMWLPSLGTSESSSPEGGQPSTEALRTWLQAAFLVNPSPSLESEQEAPTTATCGPPSGTLCGRFDPDTCSLRTFQDCLPGMEAPTSGGSSVIWPRSGLLSDGRCWELTIAVPRIGESACGFWPTARTTGPDGGSNSRKAAKGRGMWPTARSTDGSNGGPNQRGSKGDRMLPSAVMFPTPSAQQYGTNQGGQNPNGPVRPSLDTMARRGMWPTPTQRDHEDGSAKSCANVPVNCLLGRAVHGGKPIRLRYPTPRVASETGGGIGLDGGARARATEGYSKELESAGRLNPAWVEWLMGWPIGWTDLGPLATDRFRSWLLLHGDCSWVRND